ncbi:TPA: aminopeptidase P family protein [Pseudomonas aeruginosa]|nr:aminopeptidase P family protein [Pseudomonas aeruginosa]HCE9552472.1 aminopeptidase P family protein [Pseudomonas aeruginosa]
MILDNEYIARRQKVKGRLADLGADQFVATSAESIYYLCGASYEALERPFFLIIPRIGPERLVVPYLEKDHLKKARAINAAGIHTYWEFPAPPGKCWRSTLLEHGQLEKGFIFESSCPVSIADLFLGLGGRHMDLVEELRMVKSPAEIKMIRRAAHYADMGVQQLFDYSYYGSTVAEGFARTNKVTQTIIRETPDWDALSTKVLMATFPAPISGLPHSVPSAEDLLLEGPHVTLVLTRVNGYAAESERTYFTAPPSKQDLEFFNLMVEARKLGLSMLRPGVACSDIDGAVNQFLARQGIDKPEQRLHRVGHGFGLGNHEGPWLSEGSSHVLEAGMVVSIEPGIYIPGIGGYRHSDTILITPKGYELLTKAPGVEEPLVLNRKSIKHRLFRHMVSHALGMKV